MCADARGAGDPGGQRPHSAPRKKRSTAQPNKRLRPTSKHSPQAASTAAESKPGPSPAPRGFTSRRGTRDRPQGRRLVTWIAAAFATATIGALVTFFLPPVLEKMTASPDPPGLSATLQFGTSFEPESVLEPIYIVPHGTADPRDGQSSADGLYQFAAKQEGAIPHVRQVVRVLLRGPSDEPAVITDIRPVVLKHESPLQGWFPTCCEAGGIVNVRWITINLDCPQLTALFTSETVEEGLIYEGDYTLEVSRTDIELLEINAISHFDRISWGLDIHYEFEGKSSVLKIRDDRLRVSPLALGQEGISPFAGDPPSPVTKEAVGRLAASADEACRASDAPSDEPSILE